MRWIVGLMLAATAVVAGPVGPANADASPLTVVGGQGYFDEIRYSGLPNYPCGSLIYDTVLGVVLRDNGRQLIVNLASPGSRDDSRWVACGSTYFPPQPMNGTATIGTSPVEHAVSGRCIGTYATQILSLSCYLYIGGFGTADFPVTAVVYDEEGSSDGDASWWVNSFVAAGAQQQMVPTP